MPIIDAIIDAIRKRTSDYAEDIEKAVDKQAAAEKTTLKGYYANKCEVVSPHRRPCAESPTNKYVNQWIDDYIADLSGWKVEVKYSAPRIHIENEKSELVISRGTYTFDGCKPRSAPDPGRHFRENGVYFHIWRKTGADPDNPAHWQLAFNTWRDTSET